MNEIFEDIKNIEFIIKSTLKEYQEKYAVLFTVQVLDDEEVFVSKISKGCELCTMVQLLRDSIEKDPRDCESHALRTLYEMLRKFYESTHT